MALNPADIATVSRLLDEALALDPAQSEPWLAALPAEHQRHAQALRDMLAQEAQLDTDPRLEALPKLAIDDAVASAGDRVGPYRLLHEIGRGGMGSVWLAERADGAYKRQVALKLPRLAWGAGLAERMAREREIGMLLEHPNIARLYDAGVDERGRPFLALEFIDGQPIDAWCEAQDLSVRDRLRLFVQVIKAVAYAHGRLVVHRDLKPSNVLVTSDGQAHLLDFGIAKLLLEVAPGEPGLTQEQGRVLTPHYASPEQVAGEAITVQSDVYSLGVLLYELLTGTLPIDPKRSTLGAVEEAILEGDAPLASSRVKDRITARALRGEVDAILAKAMQREPGRRYATADALALDIERFLQGETVAARPDSRMYRLNKALRKHWVGVSAAAAVLLAIFTGSAVAVVQARHANDAAERARVVKEFVVDVFKVNERGNPANQELKSLPAELLLERGARLIETKFAGQSDLQAELYGVVTRILLDMGASKAALEYAAKFVAALEVIGASADARAEGLTLMGEALGDEERLSDAQQSARAALKLAAELPGPRLRARLLLADLLLKGDGPSAALAELDLADADLAGLPSSPSPVRARALSLRGRAMAASNQYSISQARPFFDRAIAEADASEVGSSRLAARTRIELADMLLDTDYPAASLLHKAAFSAMRSAGGADTIAAIVGEANAAFLYSSNGLMAYEQADEIVVRSITEVAQLGSKVPRLIRARLESRRGCLASNLGRVELAYSLLSASTPVIRADAPESRTGACLGFAAMDAGHHDEAERIHLQSIAPYAQDASAAYVNFYLALSRNRLMQGKYDGARAALDGAPAFPRLQGLPEEQADWQAQSVATMRAWIDLDQGDYRSALQRLHGLPNDDRSLGADSGLIRATALCESGLPDRGLPTLEAKLRNYEALVYAHNPAVAYWRSRAGLCALAAGQRDRAKQLAAGARAAFTAQPGVSPYYKAPLFKLERTLGLRLPAV
jgi:hypothetical protein